jgi:hypothetical protein
MKMGAEEESAWEEVLNGYRAEDDFVYQDYKMHVVEFHFTPVEIFNLRFPDDPAKDDEFTVISYALIQVMV